MDDPWMPPISMAFSTSSMDIHPDGPGSIHGSPYLAACDFTHKLLYIFSGWEGSATDSTMSNDAHITDLWVPPGCYYLTDVGFPNHFPSCSLIEVYTIILQNGVMQNFGVVYIFYCLTYSYML